MPKPDLSAVKVLIFDAGGTVFDWSAPVVSALARSGAGISVSDSRAIALACRGHFMRLNGEVVRGDRPWQVANSIYREAIGIACKEAGLSGLSEADWSSLFSAWRKMPAWASARESIARLRERFIIAPLTVLSWSMVVESSRGSGITWDSVLSCDVLGVYKPDPRCFTRVTEIVNCEASEIMMVASHPSDVVAGIAAGYRSAYIEPRLFDPGEDYSADAVADRFDVVASDFADLAIKLLNH